MSQGQAVIAKRVSAQKAGRVIADAVTGEWPRTRYTVGREAAMPPLLAVLPDRFLARILVGARRPHLPKASA